MTGVQTCALPISWIRVRDPRRSDGLDRQQLHRAARRCQGGVGHRPGGVGMTFQQNEAGGAPKYFGSPPASTDSGYQACSCGLRGMASAFLRCATTAAPPKESSLSSAFRNYAGPQHFYHYRGMCSAWVPGSVLGSLTWEFEPSLLARPWPYQASVPSFVLRDRGHIKCQFGCVARSLRHRLSYPR